jgi:hypothetical protein
MQPYRLHASGGTIPRWELPPFDLLTACHIGEVRSTIVAICLLLSIPCTYGHHSFAAEFDANKPVRLEGIITSVDWVNPHITIHLDVKSDEWSVEASSPNALSRRGLSKSRLTPGLKVVIEGFQSRSTKYRATGNNITFPDGLRIVLDQHGP